VCVGQRLQTREVLGSPDFDASVPRNGVQQGAVFGQGERGHSVHVMNPRALLVPADLDMVLRDQNLGGAVSQGGECGHVRVFSMVVVIMVVVTAVADFPDADFVVLVGAEEFVRLDY